MEITISLTDDWTVDSYQTSDVWPAVFLTSPNGAQLRFEGDSDVLARIGRAWVAEFDVAANGRNPDAHDPGCWATPIEDRPPGAHHHMDDCRCEAGNPNATLDEIDAKIANLQQMLTEHREEKGEEARYPDDMVTGDWVRFPPQRTWRKIDGVNETNTPHHNREIVYTFGGTQYHQSVRAGMRYPYCTEENKAKVDQ
jgi:hypothetical protein